jgi:predicted O-methyltransferase YrrM
MIELNPDCDISYHLTALRDFVKLIHAQYIVELGVRSGNSTQALILGAMETGGKVRGYDIERRTLSWMEPEYNRYFEYIIADDTKIAPVESMDLLFIDTSHEAGHTSWELENWGKNVRKGGLILLHDTTNISGVFDPAKRWSEQNKKTFLNDNNQHGFGIILI